MLVTDIEDNINLPFLIAATQRCKEGSTRFPELIHFTLDPYLIMLSVKQGGIKYHFLICSNRSMASINQFRLISNSRFFPINYIIFGIYLPNLSNAGRL